jgi:acetolactate synthase-1/2/3 large subunit
LRLNADGIGQKEGEWAVKATAMKATAMKATVDEAIVQTLLARGVDVVFGMPGSHINAFYATLSKTQIRLVTVKHEGNGAVMADVYGRLTGKPGVLITTAGPGSTNALSGIAQAYNALSPVVHIAGGVHRGAANEGFHGCTSEDFLLKVFQPVTKWSSRITQPELVPRILNEAFDVAVSGKPGPVHVQIPWDLYRIGQVEMEPLPPQGEQRRGVRNRSILASMMEIIGRASCPVICAGKGVLAQGALECLRKFAEAMGMPVITPRTTFGIFPTDHPLFAGFSSNFATQPVAKEKLSKADVVLAIGLTDNTEDLEVFHREAKGRFLFVGCDSSDRIDLKAEIGVVENAREALQEMLKMAGNRGKAWDPNIRSKRKAEDEKVDAWVEGYRQSKPLHFALALKELGPFLTRETVCILDVGSHNILTNFLLPIYGKAEIVATGSYGGMGFALPGAIAAKAIYPDKRVVGITGDGAFLLSCSDFVTAVEQKHPLVIVILNDSRYGMMRYLSLKRYGHSYPWDIGKVDFAKQAESCGGVGFRVTDPSDLKAAFQEAFSAKVPAVVDVVSVGDPYPPE